MAAYATIADVQARLTYTMSDEQEAVCDVLLADAAVMIDAVALKASADVKKVVSCRMVIRIIGDPGDRGVPIGATQGSQAALGYSQSWTISNGSSGELYLSKADKLMLGVGNKIGARSPLERCSEVVSLD